MLLTQTLKSHFKIAKYRGFASSVREKEIEFYSNLEDWWSPDGPQKQLHKFNRLRVNFIRRHLI